MRASEVWEMTDQELKEQDTELRRALFNLRIQFATGQLDNTAKLKATKQDLARVLTVLRERKRGQAAKGS